MIITEGPCYDSCQGHNLLRKVIIGHTPRQMRMIHAKHEFLPSNDIWPAFSKDCGTAVELNLFFFLSLSSA